MLSLQPFQQYVEPRTLNYYMDWKPPRNVIQQIVAILVAPRSQPFQTKKDFCEVVLALEWLTVTERCSFVEVNPF